MHYVGLEERIMSETRTWVGTTHANSTVRVFERTDPLLVFMLQHRHLFSELSADDMQIRSTEAGTYFVKETLVQRVQQFFRSQVLPLIQYLPDDCAHLVLRAVNPPENMGLVMIQVQVDYVSVFPNGSWAWPCKEINVTSFIYFF